VVPPSAEGRWTAIGSPHSRSLTEWATAFAQQLLARHGLVTREVASIEQLPGGFSTIYPVLRRMEETGRVRRGYFVAGLGAAQFAQPGAIDLLRATREDSETPAAVTLAATDPANPFGALLPWPGWSGTESHGGTESAATAHAGPMAIEKTAASAPLKGGSPGVRASRSAGARVVIVDGRLTAWIGRGDRSLLVSLPPDEPDRSRVGRALAVELVALAHRAPEGSRGWLIEEINGAPAAGDAATPFLIAAGFAVTAMGLQLRVARRTGRLATDMKHVAGDEEAALGDLAIE
jgi:ATP-dependent Lhr-like helicase